MTLNASHLHFSYTSQSVIEDFSLTLQPGDFTVLLGPNGCGKSTLLKLLAGRLIPQSGEVTVNDTLIGKLPGLARASLLAVVPQAAPPALAFTVRDRVAIGCRARLSPLARLTPQHEEDIRHAMELFAIDQLADRPCQQLSGGELQRVHLAAAIAQKPQYLLLDEPTAALDPAHAVSAIRILQSLPQPPGIFLITHDIDLARHAAKRLLMMKDGRILFDGTPQDVLTPVNLSAIYGCPASLAQGLTFF